MEISQPLGIMKEFKRNHEEKRNDGWSVGKGNPAFEGLSLGEMTFYMR
jgi:hypothetical protein